MEFFLRKSKDEDIFEIYNLVNRKYIEKYSERGIDEEWERHRDWYRFLLGSPENLLYTVCGARGSFCGYVRFELKGETGVISLILSDCIRGKGLSKAIIELGVLKLKEDVSNIKCIAADIVEENARSIRSFEAVGFVKKGTDSNGIARYARVMG